MMRKNLNSQTRDALAYHLATLGFTHFVTLNFGLRAHVVPPELEDEKVSITSRFLYRLGRRVMGRCDERLEYVATFERFTKGRNPTPFHGHILLKVPSEREPLLHKHAQAIFKRLEASNRASCDIKLITDPLDVSDYFAKQYDCGETILATKPVLASDAEHT
jgi:hypothetical protein